MKNFVLGLVAAVALLIGTSQVHAGHCGYSCGVSYSTPLYTVAAPVVTTVTYQVPVQTVAIPVVTAPVPAAPVVQQQQVVTVAAPAYTAPVYAAPVYAAPVVTFSAPVYTAPRVVFVSAVRNHHGVGYGGFNRFNGVGHGRGHRR